MRSPGRASSKGIPRPASLEELPQLNAKKSGLDPLPFSPSRYRELCQYFLDERNDLGSPISFRSTSSNPRIFARFFPFAERGTVAAHTHEACMARRRHAPHPFASGAVVPSSAVAEHCTGFATWQGPVGGTPASPAFAASMSSSADRDQR
jgi:hypothetical protein